MTQSWPDQRARRALLYTAAICAAIVISLGFVVYDSVNTWVTPGTKRFHFFGIPVDGFAHSLLAMGGGTQLLVIFGQPPVLIAVTLIFTVIALACRDPRLAVVTFAGPLTAAALTELVAKPFFHRTAGTFFTYPSGHVTATTALAATAAVVACRHLSRTALFYVTPALILIVIASMFGVVALHWHDGIDAVGGLAMGLGCVCLWTTATLARNK